MKTKKKLSIVINSKRNNSTRPFTKHKTPWGRHYTERDFSPEKLRGKCLNHHLIIWLVNLLTAKILVSEKLCPVRCLTIYYYETITYFFLISSKFTKNGISRFLLKWRLLFHSLYDRRAWGPWSRDWIESSKGNVRTSKLTSESNRLESRSEHSKLCREATIH